MSTKSDLYWGKADNVRIYIEHIEYVERFLKTENKIYIIVSLGTFELEIEGDDLYILHACPDIPRLKIWTSDVIDFSIDKEDLEIVLDTGCFTGIAFQSKIWDWDIGKKGSIINSQTTKI